MTLLRDFLVTNLGLADSPGVFGLTAALRQLIRRMTPRIRGRNWSMSLVEVGVLQAHDRRSSREDKVCVGRGIPRNHRLMVGSTSGPRPLLRGCPLPPQGWGLRAGARS